MADEPTTSPVADAIRTRRTSLLVDPEAPVAREVIEHLLGLATWAPNHKRTWPWRFTVVRGEARGAMGAELAAAAADAGMEPGKVAKLARKYRRSPVVVLVWQVASDDEHRRREDRDATAAAVQNLLLAATEEGLASYWASVPDVLHEALRSFAGVDDDHQLVALVYLGWPTATSTVPGRPEPVVTWIDE